MYARDYYPIRNEYLNTHRNCSSLRTKLGKSANNIISSKSNHKIYQVRHDSAHEFSGCWMHWYKMVTGIKLIRYQTKYRPKEHQKFPFKKTTC